MSKPANTLHPYRQVLMLVERLRGDLHDVVEDEMVRCGYRLNGTQALLLHDASLIMAESHATEIRIADLRHRSCYAGTSLQYSIDKLDKDGYARIERFGRGGAGIFRFTDTGLYAVSVVAGVLHRQSKTIGRNGHIGRGQLKMLADLLAKIETTVAVQ